MFCFFFNFSFLRSCSTFSPSSDSLNEDTVGEDSAVFFSSSFRISSSEMISSSLCFEFDFCLPIRSLAARASSRSGVPRSEVEYGGVSGWASRVLRPEFSGWADHDAIKVDALFSVTEIFLSLL